MMPGFATRPRAGRRHAMHQPMNCRSKLRSSHQPMGWLPIYPHLENIQIVRLVCCNYKTGAISRRDAAEFAFETKECRWCLARHSHCGGQVHMQKVDRVAHGACHVQIGSGERAVRTDADSILDTDLASLKVKGLLPAADARHCVGHQ